jgi:hypothetical protein
VKIIEIACPSCKRGFQTLASGEPWTIPVAKCPSCDVLVGRVIFPQGRATVADKRAFPSLPPFP